MINRFRPYLSQLTILIFLGSVALVVILFNLAAFRKPPSQTLAHNPATNPIRQTSLTIFPTPGLTPFESRTPRLQPLPPRLKVTLQFNSTSQPYLSTSGVLHLSTSSVLNQGPCSCQADTLDCTYADFPNLADAQACYDYCMGAVGYDVHNLDQNFDGVACESGLH